MVVPEVEELGSGEPATAVLENATRKARAGRGLSAGRGAALVLGVDTDVALDGRLLGKPADVAGARERLEALAGRSHEVLSGVVVIESGQRARERAAVARTEVRFRELDESILTRYLGSGEWRDRAGAYAIQGLGSILLESIRGDFSNVVGLPVRTLLELAPEVFPAAR